MESPNPPIHKIPPELIGTILNFLPLIDKICLLLTCKSLYSYFDFFLKSPTLNIHQYFPPKKPTSIYDKANRRIGRGKLLHQLQNNRWQYCPDCWTLHPRSSWLTPIPSNPCSPHGEVDICPCLRISFQDKKHIIDHLREQKPIAGNWAWLTQPLEERAVCMHHCRKEGYFLATSFEMRGMELVVTSSFAFVNSGESGLMRLAVESMVGDGGVVAWLNWYFRLAGEEFFIPPGCGCEVGCPAGWKMTGAVFLMVSITRNLGGCRWPDEAWDRNRCC